MYTNAALPRVPVVQSCSPSFRTSVLVLYTTCMYTCTVNTVADSSTRTFYLLEKKMN